MNEDTIDPKPIMAHILPSSFIMHANMVEMIAVNTTIISSELIITCILLCINLSFYRRRYALTLYLSTSTATVPSTVLDTHCMWAASHGSHTPCLHSPHIHTGMSTHGGCIPHEHPHPYLMHSYLSL